MLYYTPVYGLHRSVIHYYYSFMKSSMIAFLTLLLLCYYSDIFIVFLAFCWSNKPAAVIQLLREYRWVVYLAYHWGNTDPVVMGDKVLRRYH